MLIALPKTVCVRISMLQSPGLRGTGGDSVDGTGGEGPEAVDRQYLLASVFGPAADALLAPCLLIDRS